MRILIKRCANNANDTGEPASMKLNKYSEYKSSGMNLNSGDSALSLVANEEELESCCAINEFPTEVLLMIFSQFDWKDRLTYRLVCKLWHEIITDSSHVSLRVRSTLNDRKTAERLEKCDFKVININFHGVVDINDLPLALWGQIGSQIRVLYLSDCLLGDHVMKGIFLNCHNLRKLKVDLKNEIPAESFCSLSMLESLKNVALENLKKFKIKTYYDGCCSSAKCDDVWAGILEAVFRLFPALNYVGFESIHYYHEIKCTFIRETNENEDSELGRTVARLLFYNNCERADIIDSILNILATQSMKMLDLTFKKPQGSYFTKNDEVELLNFFGRQKKLEVLSFCLYQEDGILDAKMLKAIFLKIIQSCPDLSELNFWPENSCLPWLLHIQEYRINLKLRKLDINYINVSPNCLRITGSNPKNQIEDLMGITQKYAYVVHLDIECEIPDEIFQCIFQHMTNLKTLEFRWSESNTAFALSGCQNDVTQSATRTGYSIKRLQNLESLIIKWYSFWEYSGFNNEIFCEFQFPKLHHLEFYPPEEISVLDNFGIGMPSLRTIEFLSSINVSPKALVNLCQSTKKLQRIFVEQSYFGLEEAKTIFQVCPSLQLVRTEHYEFFYEPFTKQVREHCIVRTPTQFG